ncbi:GNAT family N-acetyltransferase [Lactobacillus sp. S2-2]|uniref:GNAT family N-acetyltransferase n=1 Tax=Lactobacillus sp. S2-2 TaxID=2692917 RepID=UPI001F007230|nr:GNAT family N-acetyltransferase [Lactobacillus sp. S2-2]MCF6515303.1 GNAT family N-acetyltransferase [Lactobacillus sp. S2-2]
MWKIKKFDELTNRELYKIYALRSDVFIVDQNRIYRDQDENDLNAFHIFKEKNGDLVAYARVFLESDKNKVTFGRVVTSNLVRGTGIGKELMNQIMNLIHNKFSGLTIEIEAQEPVQGFYKQFGFKSVGDVFIHASTPHIKMIHDRI